MSLRESLLACPPHKGSKESLWLKGRAPHHNSIHRESRAAKWELCADIKDSKNLFFPQAVMFLTTKELNSKLVSLVHYIYWEYLHFWTCFYNLTLCYLSNLSFASTTFLSFMAKQGDWDFYTRNYALYSFSGYPWDVSCVHNNVWTDTLSVLN